MTIENVTIVPMGKTAYLHMRIDEAMKARIDAAAKRRTLDTTSFVMHAIVAQYPEVIAQQEIDLKGKKPNLADTLNKLYKERDKNA